MKLEVSSLAALLNAKNVTRHQLALRIGWDDSRVDQFCGGYRGKEKSRGLLLAAIQELCSLPDLTDEDLVSLIAGDHGKDGG